MNRIIKFRGKSVETGEWIYGDLIHRTGIPSTVSPVQIDDTAVDPETVGQFTGLLDVNGKEIWEGDLLRQTNFNGEKYEALYEVLYDIEGFCQRMISGNPKAMSIGGLSAFYIFAGDIRLRKGEIIGNIHDNPEPIKSAE